MLNKDVVFGTIMECDQNNNLIVQLENGEIGKMAASEISRRALGDQMSCEWMVGRRHGCFAGDVDAQGYRILSGKAYEEHLYNEIVRAYRAKERNVYTARLVSVTRDGRLAFYRLAQGVNASVYVADFAYTRVQNFNEIIMPKELTVAIRDVDGNGKIQLYTKLGFGDFASNTRRMGIVPGSVVEGFVSGFVPSNGDGVVTLAPNLTVLTTRVPLGEWVKVQISRVNEAEQRLKGDIISKDVNQQRSFIYGDWCVDASEYPPYVDIQEFEGRIGPRSRTTEKPAPVEEEIQISYETTAEVSPFTVRDGEVGVRSPLKGGMAKCIVYEAQRGLLNENHMLVAKAVNDLKYTTSWQIQRYLHLRHDLALSEVSIRKIITRLIKHDIIHVLHFRTGEHQGVAHILYPGAALYQAYTGENRSLPAWAYSAAPDVAFIKGCLSSNQLLLGALHSWDSIAEVHSRVFITTDGGIRIRPRHRITEKDGSPIYLESVRKGQTDEILDKLQRYDAYVNETQERIRVMVTMETENEIAAFAKKVVEKRLSFDVMLTCDLKCLPVPVLHTVEGYVRVNRWGGFFGRIRNMLAEATA